MNSMQPRNLPLMPSFQSLYKSASRQTVSNALVYETGEQSAFVSFYIFFYANRQCQYMLNICCLRVFAKPQLIGGVNCQGLSQHGILLVSGGEYL